MALKRLDEEFELKPGTQLLPYMKRLLPSLEGRFQSLETERKTYDVAIAELRAVALARINEILIPATEDIVEVTTLGFLLGPSTSSVLLEIGVKQFIIIEGPQRETFTPSPYVIVERQANIDDYAIARVQYYTRETGELSLYLTAVHGNPGPWNDWVISSTPGMADSTKLYHDAVGPMHDQVEADTAIVLQAKDEVLAAAEALEAAGLDAQAFIRRDGTVPFIATQRGINPAVGSNDTTLVTSSWSRARMIEYAGNALQKTGGTMTGPLTLSGAPTQTLHAVTKAYVDSIIGAGGVISNSVTINAVNPAVRLQSTGTGQTRQIAALGSGGAYKWVMNLADSAAETGGEAGSNFSLVRYSDNGSILDTALGINRQTGITSVRGLSSSADINVTGDISIYRLGAPNTSVLYMNQAKTAYHHFDGATHQLSGGGLNCGPLTSGHINCLSVYTQGHAITTWGLTSHGHAQINSSLRTQAMYVQSAGPMIVMEDTTWGNMHIHHQDGNIGFLNHVGNWIQYTNINGHIYSPAYGWMHDYINNTASNHAWSAADYRYNQCVTRCRWVHAGDIDTVYHYYQLAEISHAAITGLWCVGSGYNGYGSVYQIRFRQPQHLIAGGWYTSHWES